MKKIQLVNIAKSFNNKKVLENIEFGVNQGEILSLLGASGCGKSTTLKIIAGLIEPDYGEVYISGENVAAIAVENRGTVIVFQENLLFPHMTVEENIGFGLKMAKKSKPVVEYKVKEILELLAIEGMEKKYPHQLSGGQKQRVALGRALAVDPTVLLLDEPFSSLDLNIRNDMRDMFLHLQRKLNITTILVTHDKEEAMMMSNHIALMKNGHIIQHGTPKEIYDLPRSKEASLYFGNRNYIKGEVKEGNFRTISLHFKVTGLENGYYEAMIKPEQVKVGHEDLYSIKAVVVDKKYAGDRVYYSIKDENTVISAMQGSNVEYEVGMKVSFNIDSSKNIYFKLY